MGAWTPQEVAELLNALFQMNANLVDIKQDTRAIRLLLEDEDERGDEEED